MFGSDKNTTGASISRIGHRRRCPGERKQTLDLSDLEGGREGLDPADAPGTVPSGFSEPWSERQHVLAREYLLDGAEEEDSGSHVSES